MMTVLLLMVFAAGFGCYVLTGSTPRVAYGAMRRLHTRTNGRVNDLFLSTLRYLKPGRLPASVSGFLGNWTAAELQRVAQAVEADGLVVLDRMLDDEACEALRNFALSTPARPLGQADRELYKPDTAHALRYDIDERDILRQAEACRIALDGTFAAIANAYFRCRPVYDFTTMWWTTPHGPKNYSQAAQEFHYDMDRLFFLKCFVYLTDVNLATGPHVFVTGSHRRKPPQLRRDGRYTDAEIESHYPRDRILSICGKRGTVFVADTRGFHKGLSVLEGDRLVLQVEFAVSLFGQNYPKCHVGWGDLQSSGFKELPDRRVFQNIVV